MLFLAPTNKLIFITPSHQRLPAFFQPLIRGLMISFTPPPKSLIPFQK